MGRLSEEQYLPRRIVERVEYPGNELDTPAISNDSSRADRLGLLGAGGDRYVIHWEGWDSPEDYTEEDAHRIKTEPAFSTIWRAFQQQEHEENLDDADTDEQHDEPAEPVAVAAAAAEGASAAPPQRSGSGRVRKPSAKGGAFKPYALFIGG